MLLASDPHNAVRLILPDRYDDAARLFREWQADGTLVDDEQPTFSVYRMTYTDDDGRERSTTGVIGALSLDADGVLPHERTLPKAKSDRLELLACHTRELRAHLGPLPRPRPDVAARRVRAAARGRRRPRRRAARAVPTRRSRPDRRGRRARGRRPPRARRRPPPVRDRVHVPRRTPAPVTRPRVRS